MALQVFYKRKQIGKREDQVSGKAVPETVSAYSADAKERIADCRAGTSVAAAI